MSDNKKLFHVGEDLSEAKIIDWLRALRDQTFAPVSGYAVTAVLKVKKGDQTVYVAGVNVENAEIALGTCAEIGAMAAAVAALGKDITIEEAWVMGAPKDATSSKAPCTPCGKCRQNFAHFAEKTAKIHSINLDGDLTGTMTVAQMLENAFTLRDVNQSTAPSQNTNAEPLTVEALEARIHRPSCDKREIYKWMMSLESDTQTGIHRPYVVELQNGAYIASVALQNEAFPTSISPAAAVAALTKIRYPDQKITRIWQMGIPEAQKNGSEEIVADQFYTPTASDFQILRQHILNGNVGISFVRSDGKEVIPKTFKDITFAYLPTTEKPFFSGRELQPFRSQGL